MNFDDLNRAIDREAPSDRPSEQTLQSLAATLAADLKPVRPLPSSSWIGVVFAAIVSLALVIIFWVFRLRTLGLAAMSVSQATFVLSALVLSLGLLCDSLARQMVPGARHRVNPRALPVGIAVFLAGVIGARFNAEPDSNFLADMWLCIKICVGLGAVAALPFWLVLRRGASMSPTSTGASVGLLAGLVGTTVLQLHCPILDVWHILLSHLAPALLCALTGILWARFRESQ